MRIRHDDGASEELCAVRVQGERMVTGRVRVLYKRQRQDDLDEVSEVETRQTSA